MEKNDHNRKDNKPISLMGHIRLVEEAAKQNKVDIKKELSRPWRSPNTNKIYCGVEVAKRLQDLLGN